MSQDRFFGKIFGTFWKNGRPRQVYSGRIYPNSRNISIYIERASHNNIGRRGAPKISWRKNYIFFWTSFFLIRKGWRARTRQIFYMCTTVFSDFVVTKKKLQIFWEEELKFFFIVIFTPEELYTCVLKSLKWCSDIEHIGVHLGLFSACTFIGIFSLQRLEQLYLFWSVGSRIIIFFVQNQFQTKEKLI